MKKLIITFGLAAAATLFSVNIAGAQSFGNRGGDHHGTVIIETGGRGDDHNDRGRFDRREDHGRFDRSDHGRFDRRDEHRRYDGWGHHDRFDNRYHGRYRECR